MKGPLAKLCFALTAVALATLTVTDASADGATSATGASGAAFSSLPPGRIPLPPSGKAPAAIGAGEKVPGFFIATFKGRSDSITIAPTAKMAKQIAEGSHGDGATGNEACFTEHNPAFAQLRRGGDESESTWRPNLQPTLTMSTSSRQSGQRPTVTAVHSERIAEEGGRTSLEIIDAWVDPNTRGVRLITRSSVPLEPVSTLFGGSKLYAAREAETVHVILVMPREQKRSGREGLFVTADNNVFNSSCDHIRAVLKTEKGQGQTASFVATVELPSLTPKDPKEPKTEQPPTAGARFGIKPEEARLRPMHVHASVSWPSREKEALLSVSAGWDSRERLGFVF